MARTPGWLALAVALAACHPESTSSEALAAPGETDSTDGPERAPAESGPAVAAPTGPRPIVVVSTPSEIAALSQTLDFSKLLVGTEHASTRALWRHRRYTSIVEENDTVGYYRKGNGAAFPRWWMRNSKTFFELVGVANRLDRKDVRVGTCGETRLLYRLAWRDTEERVRRLPVALNLVFEQPDDGHGCRDVAQRWIVERSDDVIATLTGAKGPLRPDLLALDRLLAIEINARQEPQATDNADSTHLLNRLSALPYDRARGVFVEAPLEFQPDETIYHKAFTPRRALRSFITDASTMEKVALGTATFPVASREHVPLARRLSPATWTMFGLEGAYLQRYEAPALDERGGGDERVGPFTAIFPPDAFATDLRPDDEFVASAAALLHRLDGQSCSGCHRQRSIAGFHFPGAGGEAELRDGMSPHLLAQLEWRQDYVAAIAAGEPPNLRRPMHDEGPAGFGAHCSTEDSPIAGRECPSDLSCRPVPGFAYGACMPADYGGPAPCTGASSEGGTCLGPPAVFPGGFRATACTDDAPCAAIPTIADLAACRRAADPWACADARAGRFVVDACMSSADCRDGYACVGETTSVCKPAMLVPEYRLFGHPLRAG
jgi:hypothetical protein